MGRSRRVPLAGTGWRRCDGCLEPASADTPLAARVVSALFDQQRYKLAEPRPLELTRGGCDDVANLALGQVRIGLLQPDNDVRELDFVAHRRHVDVLAFPDA